MSAAVGKWLREFFAELVEAVVEGVTFYLILAAVALYCVGLAYLWTPAEWWASW